LGDAAAAHAVLEPLITRSGLGQPTAEAAAADEIEALLGMGKVADAEALLAAFAAQAERTRRPRALAAIARSTALAAAARDDLDEALAQAERAVELAAASEPLEWGRALLVLGLVRRRAKRRRAAREALESALAVFDALPAPLWAGRARAELERIGGRRGSAGELTPSERGDADSVPDYCLELYLAGGSQAALEEAAERARAAAESFGAPGGSVRYLRSTYLPEDETCLHFFAAASGEDVAEAARQAGLTGN